MMLCDFHIHTTFSDGFRDEKDNRFFGGRALMRSPSRHVVNGDNAIGKFATVQSVDPGDNFDEYLGTLRQEAQGTGKYGMP
jgi:hypothetical protein